MEIYSKYQEIVRVEDHSIIGHEATIAGVDGTPAHVLFQRAEKDSSVVSLDRHARTLSVRGFSGKGLLFLNVSNYSIIEGDLYIPPHIPLSRVVFEVVEQQLSRSSLEVLKSLVDKGASLAIDDFGKGYSTYDLYRTGYFKYIKLDKCFASDLNNTYSQSVIRSILSLCEETGGEAIVEGVETYGQYTRLVEMGAKYLQGYYFGRPSKKARNVLHIPSMPLEKT